MRQDPIPVVVSFPLTEQTRATIEGASPLVRIIDYPTEPIAPGSVRLPPTSDQARALAEAEVIFGSHLDPLEVHDAAPNLKWLQVLTAGLDELIAQGILERDFTITTMSGVGAVPIAEYCMGVMVMLEKGLHEAMRDQVEHRWNFHFAGQLKGQTCGIVGLGAIGRELARRARAFGMRVVATRRSAQPGDSDPDVDELLPSTELPRLLAESDYVVLCVPLTAETDGMIGADGDRADEAGGGAREHRAGVGHRGSRRCWRRCARNASRGRPLMCTTRNRYRKTAPSGISRT